MRLSSWVVWRSVLAAEAGCTRRHQLSLSSSLRWTKKANPCPAPEPHAELAPVSNLSCVRHTFFSHTCDNLASTIPISSFRHLESRRHSPASKLLALPTHAASRPGRKDRRDGILRCQAAADAEGSGRGPDRQHASSSGGSSTPSGPRTFPHELQLTLSFSRAQKIQENCFTKCVPTPGTSLSSGEKTCVTTCTEKYLQAWNQVNAAFIDRIRKESQ